MSRYFVGSRTLAGFRLVEIDQTAVVDQYQRLQQFITQRAGPEVARLLAEPVVSRGNDQATARIDWYSQFDGTVRPLGDLDPGTLGLVRERLVNRLTALRALAFDPGRGAEVAAALNVLAASSVMAVGDEPIILDWGLVPADLKDLPPRERHFDAVLGTYLANFPLPPLSRAEWQERFAQREGQGSPTSEAASTVAAAASSVSAGPPPTPSPSWRAPAIATAVAAILLLVLHIPGVLRYPGQEPGRAAEAEAVEAAVIAQLERRRQQLELALAAPCGTTPPGQSSFLVPPPPSRVDVGPPRPTSPPATGGASASASSRPGTAGSPSASAAGGAGTPPAEREAPGTPPITPEGQPTSNMDLAERISRGVVVVIAGNSSGTGFFITPELVVTNRHVIENQPSIRIAGRSVGTVQASLVRQGSDETLGDYALLRVPAQRDVIPFTLTTQVQALGAVVAAGFPGLHLGTDPVFRRLIQGDASAAREMSPVYLTGVVSHLQRFAEASTTLVLHSAEISPGNSGGPLVDYCGRVVGVNTFGRTHNRMPVTARYALGSDGLVAFLQGAGVTAPQTTTACAPRLTPPAPGVPAATAAAAAPGGPGDRATPAATPDRPAAAGAAAPATTARPRAPAAGARP